MAITTTTITKAAGWARPGWLTGRRPAQGQVFPHGVYNK